MNHGFAYLSTSGFLGIAIDKAANKPMPLQALIGMVVARTGLARFLGLVPYVTAAKCYAMLHPHILMYHHRNTQKTWAIWLCQTPVLMPCVAHWCLWLGGDHSITLQLLRAYKAHYKTPLACIHFDAHCDTWADHFGEPSGHGTWVYEAITEGLVDPKCFVQIGIRSSGERTAREFVSDQGGKIYTARASYAGAMAMACNTSSTK